MSFELDDSIREDFLAEAGEIVEQLSEELVQLERSPKDADLLNSIFRGFHTVKGGAGFLNIAPLVDLCHAAEEAFDAMRNGKLDLTPSIMDSVLQALDHVSAMLSSVSAGEEPEPAPPELPASLRALVNQAEAADAAPSGSTPRPSEPAAAPPEDAPDPAEIAFEAMVTEVRAEQPSAPAMAEAPAAEEPDGDEITDDEFEKLLDQMQESGQATHLAPKDSPAAATAAPEPVAAGAATAVAEPASSPEPAARPSTPKADGAEPGRAAGGKAPVESSVRVNVSRLDSVMNLVGELVLVRNRLTNLGHNLENDELKKAVANLDLVTSDLQNGVMQTRMQPIGKVFSRFPRLARDVARSLNKEIELTMSGEDTDLDKNLVEALADPLVHLVRNAMDHGIEPPDVREAKGKPRTGRVELAARQEGEHIVITIEDDGAGMDPERLRAKAVEKGLISADMASKLSRHECFDLIFKAGFTTMDKVSDISGRGVGMDVVKTRISALNGNVEIDSEPDVGTCVRFQVPLTLAILPTLMVRLAERTYAFPLSQVVEVFSLESDKVQRVSGRDVIMVRGKPLPVVFLSRLLDREPGTSGESELYVVVLQVGSGMVGFVCDDVLGQEEVVIKPLGKLLQDVAGFAGATITGDGHIALIFDVSGLMKRVRRAA
jgi:two-component system chemotaxis sensor kinase CheA